MDDLILHVVSLGALATERSSRHALVAQLADRHGFGPIHWRCPWCGSDQHGRPLAPAVSISTSHHHGLVAVVFDRQRRRVGLDLTAAVAPPEAEGIASLLFTPAERVLLHEAAPQEHGFARLWSSKEALGKAHGCGLSLDEPGAEGGVLDTVHHHDWLRQLEALPTGVIGMLAIDPAKPRSPVTRCSV